MTKILHVSRISKIALSATLFVASLALGDLLAQAQEKSVRPGINNSFRDPNPKEFVERFEIESREVFAKRDEIREALKIEKGSRVADIGAGTGLFTRLFSDAVGSDGQVIAVDIAQNFLDHIAKTSRETNRQNIQTLLSTPDSTNLKKNSVDVAFICDTYHHFEFPLKTMRSLHSSLKPNGRVFLIDFKRIEGESSEWTLSHVRAGQEVFEKEILSCGFRKIAEHKGILKENYFVEFQKVMGATTSALTSDIGELKHTDDSLEVVKARVAEQKAVLVDVRYIEEWDDGHVQGAVLLPLHKLHPQTDLKLLKVKLPKDKIIYTYCSAGIRSLKAGKVIVKHGYDVRPLKPGYHDLIKAGFKPEKK